MKIAFLMQRLMTSRRLKNMEKSMGLFSSFLKHDLMKILLSLQEGLTEFVFLLMMI